jgi:hypothetical protein
LFNTKAKLKSFPLLLALILLLSTTMALAGCGGGGGGASMNLTVANIEQAVQDDIEGFKKKYDDKKVTITGYYIGTHVYDLMLGSTPDQDPYNNSVFFVTCEMPQDEIDSLEVGSEVVVEGILYAILYDHGALTSSHVVLSTPPSTTGTAFSDSDDEEENTPNAVGEFDIKNDDGFTYNVKYQMYIEITKDETLGKPGEIGANIIWSDSTIEVTNTTSKKKAPIPSGMGLYILTDYFGSEEAPKTSVEDGSGWKDTDGLSFGGSSYIQIFDSPMSESELKQESYQSKIDSGKLPGKSFSYISLGSLYVNGDAGSQIGKTFDSGQTVEYSGQADGRASLIVPEDDYDKFFPSEIKWVIEPEGVKYPEDQKYYSVRIEGNSYGSHISDFLTTYNPLKPNNTAVGS